MARLLIFFVAISIVALAVLRLLPAELEASMNVVIDHEPWQVTDEARDLHQRLRIADWHSDTLLWDRDLLEAADRGHMDLPRLEAGNVTLQVFTAVTKSPRGQNYDANTPDSDNITPLVMVQGWPPRTWSSLTERALYQAERLWAAANAAPERLRVVTHRDDLDMALMRREKGPAPMVAMLGIEGMHALDGDLANVQRLWDAGYRIFGLHHFFDNELGGSLHGMSGDGLSEFGVQVVGEINRLGGIIDIAHSSEAAARDVLELSINPPIVSHTGLRGACDSARNFSDELMVDIARKGGLIGIGYWDGAVCDPSPESVVATLAYGKTLIGAGSLSLGSDYDGSTTVAFDTSELVVLTDRMLAAGFSEAEVRAIMGENTLRFLDQHLH